MCGIAGIFHTDAPRPVDAGALAAMTEVLAHRGPDGSGLWTRPGIGLGHRRLAIIDLSDAASQPMASPDRSCVVSYNGEIYNFREVRAELEQRGHVFFSNSDTEVILAAWRQWGPDSLKRLNGMFAFALYDSRRDMLLLARDRIGVKPLHYSLLADGTLIFASELKGLLAHPRVRRDICPTAIDDFLALGYVPDDTAILDGVSKLPAGHYLLLRRGKGVPEPISWWDADFSQSDPRSEDELAEELAEYLRNAVRSRMIADVPLGAFLSGGVDSSAVVALMAEASSAPVETCSIGFDQADHDESEHAARVAALYATRHRRRVVSPDDFILIDRLAAAFDEPFADASALATFRLCELAREGGKVALSGDGADEAFAGYRRYRLFLAEERWRRALPRPLRAVTALLGNHYPKLDWAPQWLRARTSLQAVGQSSGEAYAGAVGVTPPQLRVMLYTSNFSKKLSGHRAEDRYVRSYEQAPANDPLSRAQYADLKIWLPGDILAKIDRTSMAVGLEAREPLLDHRLVEFAGRLPARMRLRGGRGKWLMKRALSRHLPDDILHRRKMGFVTPVSAWFRGALASDAAAVAASPLLVGSGWLDGPALARIADDHRAGRGDHGRLLWQMLMLDRSLRHLLGFGEEGLRKSA